MSDKFIKLTNAEDDTTIVINTKYIVKAISEDEDFTTVVLSDDHADLEVSESPEKVYSLLNKSVSTGSSLSDHPETPPKAQTQVLTNDPHMENLSRHA